MDRVFTEPGISVLDFIYISALFLSTMLNLFASRNKKHSRLRYLSLLIFVLQWALIVLFREGLPVKLLATLMLMTILIVAVVLSRRREPETTEQSAVR